MIGNASEASEVEYILGHSDREIRRLVRQAGILRPFTERLLRDAGIRRGMKVLDLGCGAGDVSFLAAELVGPSGTVVGIDRSPEAIAAARRRARTVGLANVHFEATSVGAFRGVEPFDLVVGRYVLVHQSDPAAFVRTAANLARPGGVVAFHELCITGRPLGSLPDVPLWQQAGEWIDTAFRAVAPHCDAGGRLFEIFDRAGLPGPTVTCECLVGGGADSLLYGWIAATLAGVLPQLVKMQVVAVDAVAIDSFESRLRSAVVEARSQVVGPAQFCGWARV
jgi:SAM-dependent methyltransferase